MVAGTRGGGGIRSKYISSQEAERDGCYVSAHCLLFTQSSTSEVVLSTFGAGLTSSDLI